MVLSEIIKVVPPKPELEVADIFREHLDEYRQQYGLSPQEYKAAQAIMKCRTAAMGGYLQQCEDCKKYQIAYGSCKNRNCPKCGFFEKAIWLAEQEARMLPIAHYHLVFTVAHEINRVAYHNADAIYGLLFRVVGQLLNEYGQRYLGGEIGVTMVLHTWGQTMQHHIHLHCMMPAGALVASESQAHWQASKQTYLFPVGNLSAEFRDRFCEGVLALDAQDKLQFVEGCAQVDLPQIVKQMQSKKWEVFIGTPPREAQPEDLLAYLGRYFHRSAISNTRLLEIEDGQVTYQYYDNRDRDESKRGKLKTMSLSGVEFIRRFLRHVLPKGFVRIRHYGLYSAPKQKCLAIAHQLLGQPQPEKPDLTLADWLDQTLGVDRGQCPFCGQGRLLTLRDFAPLHPFQMWLTTILGVPAYGAVAQ